MVGHLVLVRPSVFRTKDTVQATYDTTISFFAWIGLFNGNKCFYQALANILGHLAYITPMSTIRDADGQLSNLHTSIFLTSFSHEIFELLIIYITDALEEK